MADMTKSKSTTVSKAGITHDPGVTALWMPPGSIRAVLAILLVIGTLALTYMMLHFTMNMQVFNITDSTGGLAPVVSAIDVGKFISGMSGLTALYTLTAIVINAYFNSGQGTDMFKDINKIIRSAYGQNK